MNSLLTDVTNKKVFNKTSLLIIKSTTAILVMYLLYKKILGDNFFGKKIIGFFTTMFIVWTISSYSKGEWEDHVLTFVLLMFISILYYSSWAGIEYIFGFGLTNPLTIGYFMIISLFSLIILVSRFTYLNVVKAIGWVIGLSTIGLFIFTYSVWGTLKNCETGETIPGKKDSFITILAIYTIWVLLLGLTFYAEITSNIKNKKIYFGIAIVIAFGLLGYTWNKCSTDKNENPKWVNTSAYISTILAWFNLFVGHYISSSFFSFTGYSILNQCAEKDDPRTISVNLLSLIYIFIGIVYIIKKFLIK